MFYSLPIETKLDIFKCLNYKELCSISQTNFYFYDFIKNFEDKLAREEFHCIKILTDDSDLFDDVPRKLIKLEIEDFGFPLNEQLEEKFKDGLEKPISLYFPDQETKNIVITLTRGFCKTIYLLQLPNIVQSKEDIKIVYNHLNKLFKCAFKSSVFEDFIFNPELIELLFENAPKQFYSQNCWLFLDCNVGDHLKFALNHLIITDYMQLSFRPDKDKTKTINILSKILMNGDKFRGVRLTSNKYFNLFDFAMNFIETTKDCSKMVDFIGLSCVYMKIILHERAENIEEHRLDEDYLSVTKYQISNKYNPKIKFSILYWKAQGKIIDIEIKQI
uniref:F-box domain-containing protein n=1 Tax=Meloidogyne enterolobii TaxID=390850 RepID=A0A6V7VZI9_MELEN|nr:unnamed protein product [Meloidogyne enterolobii]